ncbi:hypothetical protein NC653_034082 [Populus alba x Populus x berolinensis]|uniref:Uncharacterized protein n=1 Tax=Populus alba x Populus x berolinensis TaxID=444605 RepID=A0AAD6PXD6_9ROSI|nr:hypothetical protein NC653_034082 [Populus alba x Populus x berolinensis]
MEDLLFVWPNGSLVLFLFIFKLLLPLSLASISPLTLLVLSSLKVLMRQVVALPLLIRASGHGRVSLGFYDWLLDMTLNRHFSVIGCFVLGLVYLLSCWGFDVAYSLVAFMFSHLGLAKPTALEVLSLPNCDLGCFCVF